MIPSIKHMRGQRADIQLACRNKSSQFFHAESSARHQASVNLFVTHSNAPLYTRNINVVTGSKIVYISDLSARFQAFYCFCKGFYTTAGDDYFINTFSICHIKYLLENRSVLVADKIRCAVFFCRFYADRSRSDSNDSRCAAHIRSGYRHQTNWSDWDTAIRAHVAGLARGYGFTISYSYAMRYCPPNYDNWYRDTLNQMQLI